jgi:hypothetical protein
LSLTLFFDFRVRDGFYILRPTTLKLPISSECILKLSATKRCSAVYK